MISFIVIGRNEGQKLNKCLKSIYRSVKASMIFDFEIVYVDSNSGDDSINIALSYTAVKVYKLTTIFNPPIARNVGASNSTGDVLVFLDGDMEIGANFLERIFKDGKLIHPLIGGIAVDRIIHRNGKVIKEIEYHKKSIPYFKLVTGGAFIISRSLWIEQHGMDNRFVKGADPELGIRLACSGTKLLCLPELFITHNNDKYVDNHRRKFIYLKNKYHLYGSMLIYRKNFKCIYAWKRLLKQEKTFIILILSVSVGVLLDNYYLIFVYFMFILIKTIKRLNVRMIINDFFFLVVKDISVVLGYIFFFPKNINQQEIQYIKFENENNQ